MNSEQESIEDVMFPKWIEWFIQLTIVYSLVTYFFELEWVGSENSLKGDLFWLWSERIVAAIFSVEYVARWVKSRNWRYPFTPMAIVDLLAVLPFYIGFFVDMRSLRLIRTLRILRLLKFQRHHAPITRILRSFQRSLPNMAAVGFIVFVFIFYSSTFIYETERVRQPDSFTNYWDAVWWSIVTMTTVGYGDLYPTTPLGRFIGIITIVFGISVFSMFFSVLQEAFEGESDASNKDILNRLEQTEQILLKLAKKQGVEIEELVTESEKG